MSVETSLNTCRPQTCFCLHLVMGRVHKSKHFIFFELLLTLLYLPCPLKSVALLNLQITHLPSDCAATPQLLSPCMRSAGGTGKSL